MSMRTDRRRLLRTTAAGGALAGLGDLGFLPALRPVSAAGRAQGLAFAFGQGRVVVLGEAAQLSAQIAGAGRQMGMNVPGIDNARWPSTSCTGSRACSSPARPRPRRPDDCRGVGVTPSRPL
jgi:hypothetical protein